MPVFFTAYYLLPSRGLKNGMLLVGSLVFYAWGEPVYIVLMLVSIVLNWLFGMAIGGAEGSRRKSFFIAAVAVNLALLGFFKYEGFVAQTLAAVFRTELVPDLGLPLPIGISFYTLQALTYIIDVYRGEVPSQRKLSLLAMYIVSFPQLIAGPIVRYQSILDQLENRTETLSGAASGLRVFIVGLAKKVLLANICAILASKMAGSTPSTFGFIGAWGGLLAYTFQIFFDFSGYSDMAIGLGRMMGFSFPQNFNYPYIAQTITEFWRRWHMSLSSFFRDYVYIPLGGSRCSKRRHILNILIVWALTGLWHGAAWNFVGWGAYYGILLIAEKYLWGDALKRCPAFVRHIYCIVIVMLGWSFFWIGSPGMLLRFWKALAGGYGLVGSSTFWEITVWEYIPVFIVCALASTPIAQLLKERVGGLLEERKAVRSALAYAGDLALIILLLASAASVVSGSFNPFIYFQF